MRILFFLTLLVLSGCSFHPDRLWDLREIPQDPRVLLDPVRSHEPLLSREGHRERYEDYRYLHFLPWHQKGPLHDRGEVLESLNDYAAKVAGGQAKRRARLVRWVVAQGRLDQEVWPGRRAITVRRADLCGIPLGAPGALSRGGSGRARLQVSSVAPHTPLFVSRLTKDGRWALAEAPFAFGWMAVSDLAWVDEAFVRAWEGSGQIALVQDGVSVCTVKGRCVAASIGALFPLLSVGGDGSYEVAVAARAKGGRAVMERAMIEAEAAVPWPLPPTPWNLAQVAVELLGTPYGWGGLGGRRDCSSTLRDLFTPFAVWLPRHSADQALWGGRHRDVSGLGRKEKNALLLREARPFATLLWMRGHVALYVGPWGEEAVVLHNFPGVWMGDANGVRKRAPVGLAALTSLHHGLGVERGAKAGRDLLDSLQGMTFLMEN